MEYTLRSVSGFRTILNSTIKGDTGRLNGEAGYQGFMPDFDFGEGRGCEGRRCWPSVY